MAPAFEFYVEGGNGRHAQQFCPSSSLCLLQVPSQITHASRLTILPTLWVAGECPWDGLHMLLSCWVFSANSLSLISTAAPRQHQHRLFSAVFWGHQMWVWVPTAMERARRRKHALLWAEGIEIWGGHQLLSYIPAEFGLGLCCSSSLCSCEHHPYHRQLCNASRAQLSASSPWTSERRRDLLVSWRQGLRGWCDLVLPRDAVQEGFFPVQEQSLQTGCAITY